MSDIDWVLHQDEGQFFERKSCYDDTTGIVVPRDVRGVAKNVAEAMAAMANADGGTLVLGIEDDRTITGVPYQGEHLKLLHNAAKTQVTPPLKPRITSATLNGYPMLLFEVDGVLMYTSCQMDAI